MSPLFHGEKDIKQAAQAEESKRAAAQRAFMSAIENKQQAATYKRTPTGFGLPSVAEEDISNYDLDGKFYDEIAVKQIAEDLKPAYTAQDYQGFLKIVRMPLRISDKNTVRKM